MQVKPTPSGEDKISAVLLDLVAPFMLYANTLLAFKAVVGLGVAAWNLPLLTGPARQSFVEQVVQPILASEDKEDREVGEKMLTMLLQRKELYFVDDKRFIVSYHVFEEQGGFRLAVSTITSRDGGPISEQERRD